jgi:hypothetical protein
VGEGGAGGVWIFRGCKEWGVRPFFGERVGGGTHFSAREKENTGN